MKKISLTIIFILQLGSPTLLLAYENVAGSSDHPLISPYPGFYIQGYAKHDYDEAAIMVGKFDKNKTTAKIKSIEGKITNIKYQNKKRDMNVSALQLYRNYEKALKKLHAKFFLACRGKDCFINKSTDFGPYIGNWYNKMPLIYKGFNSSFGSEFGILSAEIPLKNGKKIFIMITVGVDNPNKKRTLLMSFIEPETLNTDKVAIGSPDDIQAGIDTSGKIELRGIYFDHDKSTIKPKSINTLKIIARYLSANKTRKFFVVGHTDNTGNLKHNITLSHQRADAVLNALVNMGINRNQLSAKGIGPFSPNSPNKTDEGKALNRRVELVQN